MIEMRGLIRETLGTLKDSVTCDTKAESEIAVSAICFKSNN
jgi:hypothetical protein